jgi:transposase
MGMDLLERHQGSDYAKVRFRAFWATLSGNKTAIQAAKDLNISLAAFHKARNLWIDRALEALEPKPLGRPAQGADPQEALSTKLQEEIKELKIKLNAARVREEILMVSPHLLKHEKQSKEKKSPGGEPPSPPPPDLKPVTPEERREAQHVGFMRQTHAAYFEKTKSYAGAQAKRETLNNARRTIRKKALSFVFWLSLMGIKTSEAARRLGLKPKTVKMWKRGWKKERLKARKPGRQPVPDLGHTQLALFALFTLMDYSITYETAKNRTMGEGSLRRKLKSSWRTPRSFCFCLRPGIPSTMGRLRREGEVFRFA